MLTYHQNSLTFYLHPRSIICSVEQFVVHVDALSDWIKQVKLLICSIIITSV